MNIKTEHKAKKKITYIITRGAIGGAQFHTLDLLKEFKDDYEILLISGSKGVLTEEAEKCNVRVKIIPKIDSLNVLSAVFGIYKVLKSETPDLIHVHSSLASIYGRIAAKLVKVQVLYTVHGWHFAHEPHKLKRNVKVCVEKFLRRFTTFWITVSEFDRRLGNRNDLFRHGQVATIPNGVKEIKRQSRHVETFPLSVVFVGRASYQKNCEAAIRVMEHVSSDAHLTMYASNDNAGFLTGLVDESPAKNKITLVLNDSRAAEKLHQYSVMLVTSRYEGMPLSVLEGMREGLAIVSTNVCGMDEVVKDGMNGYLLSENKEKEMAGVLDSFADNYSQLSAMQESSRALFEDNFTLTKMLRSNRQIYQKLL